MSPADQPPAGHLRVTYEEVAPRIRRAVAVEFILDGEVVGQLEATSVGQHADVTGFVETTIGVHGVEHVTG